MSQDWIIHPKKLPIWQAPDKSRTVSSLIDAERCGAKGISAGMFWLEPGHQSEPDIHPNSEEIYYVAQGTGKLVLGDQEHTVSKGMSVYIPAGVHHQSFNTGDEQLVYFWAFSPPPPETSKAEEQNWKRVQ